MAPSYRPPKPTGTSRFIFFCQAVWEYLFNGNFPFIDTDTVKVERGPNGYAFKAFLPSAGGGKGKTVDANYKLMAITQLGSSLVPANYDLLICQEWDANANGIKAGTSPVYVAKSIEARRTITAEYFFDNGDNIVQTYTYFAPTASDSSYGDNFRLATDGGVTPNELQVMERRYYSKAMLPVSAGTPVVAIGFKQCLIYTVDTNIPTGVKDPTGADVTRIEVKPFRTWGRYATQ